MELIIPDGIAVVMTETAGFGRRQPTGAPPEHPAGVPVIEVRTLSLAGRVRIVRPRRGGWFGSRRRGGRGR